MYTWFLRHSSSCLLFKLIMTLTLRPKDSFTVSIIMKVPPQLVYYVPLASEVLKFAWMQYLSFLIPTFVLLEWVKAGL